MWLRSFTNSKWHIINNECLTLNKIISNWENVTSLCGAPTNPHSREFKTCEDPLLENGEICKRCLTKREENK